MTGKPNLDAETWHYRDDTLTMLKASVAQIQSILNDGGDSVAELTESFTNLADTFNQIMDQSSDFQETNLSSIKHQIEQGIIAFQFYDRISQRLEHVSNSLESMSTLISDNDKRDCKEEWRVFQEEILEKFTMESERELFKLIISGKGIDEALRKIKSKNAMPKNDVVELF